MDIVCRHCNATYTIADHKVPAQKAAATCKRCGNRIVIAPAAQPTVSEAAGSAPPPRPAATGSPAARRHSPDIVDAFPQLKDFDAARYDLSAILRPNRKGRYTTRLNRYKVKILTAVKPTLDRLLAKDETVLRIAGGTAYYPIELLFGNGFFTTLYNRYALAATNRRLVMVNTNYRMTRTSHYLFQMPYEAVRKVSRGLFRSSLRLKRQTGGWRIFNALKRASSAEMQEMIQSRLSADKDLKGAAPALENLCPACFEAAPSGAEACPACQAAFKGVGKAALRSLLLPGWGDMYLGHRVLGALELLGSLFVWLLVLSMVLDGGSENLVVAGVILVFYNGVDALLTRHMARKGSMLETSQTRAHIQARIATTPA
jgi:predicted Zn finger-like uncharacterized protein